MASVELLLISMVMAMVQFWLVIYVVGGSATTLPGLYDEETCLKTKAQVIQQMPLNQGGALCVRYPTREALARAPVTTNPDQRVADR